jgi:hypothetical protein
MELNFWFCLLLGMAFSPNVMKFPIKMLYICVWNLNEDLALGVIYNPLVIEDGILPAKQGHMVCVGYREFVKLFTQQRPKIKGILQTAGWGVPFVPVPSEHVAPPLPGHIEPAPTLVPWYLSDAS